MTLAASGAPAPIDHPGLTLMQVEMDRQCRDAIATLDDSTDTAHRIAAVMRDTGHVTLYAMGGSHYVNRMVEPLYRELGLDTRALCASEALMSPLPAAPRTSLIVSQSGESGEIVDLLRLPPHGDRRFALTLNGASTLGRGVEAALVAAGGPENAFAATRSIILTVAMHAAILDALGHSAHDLKACLEAPSTPDVAALEAAMAPSDVVVFAGRHVMQGVAESAALSLMELSRMPAIGFETGQFRHGPFEFLRPGLGIVLLRSTGPDRDSIAPVAEAVIEAGCTVAVLDAADGPLPNNCLRVPVRTGHSLGAAMAMLLTLQQFNIAIARRRIATGIGTPLRTSKVTV